MRTSRLCLLSFFVLITSFLSVSRRCPSHNHQHRKQGASTSSLSYLKNFRLKIVIKSSCARINKFSVSKRTFKCFESFAKMLRTLKFGRKLGLRSHVKNRNGKLPLMHVQPCPIRHSHTWNVITYTLRWHHHRKIFRTNLRTTNPAGLFSRKCFECEIFHMRINARTFQQ